jgi:hypothetical protein
MNERITQLAVEAGINVIPRRPYIDEEPDGYLESDNDFVSNNYEVAVKLLEGDLLKKFAELIIDDVMNEVFVVYPGGKHGSDVKYQNITARQWINQVFGVEQ